MSIKTGASTVAFAMLLAGSAHAAPIISSVTSQGYDQTVGTATFNFEGVDALSNASGAFTGSGQLRTGSQGDSAAPFGDGSQYMSILGGTSETLVATHGFTEMQIYVGSIDDYNSFTFYSGANSQTVSGSELLSMGIPPLSPAGGDQTSQLNNRYFDIKFDAPVTSVTFGSKQNSLEFDNVNLAGGVPEPGIWAMLIVGFGLLGSALRSRSLSQSVLNA